MKTANVQIINNTTGDTSIKNNYRSIALVPIFLNYAFCPLLNIILSVL